MSAPATASVARLHDVRKVYADEGQSVVALDGVTLDIAARRFVMLVGASGSGKTTLLNMLGGIDAPTSGSVVLAGKDTAKLSDHALTTLRAREVAFVFQSFSLFPVLSALENVEYPLVLAGTKAGERRERAMAMLEAVGLADRAKSRPNELSGGQKQRVAIARALVKSPSLVLADEPTANLDSRTGAEIVLLMRRVQEQHGATFVFSTHDPALMAHADETFVVQDGRVSRKTSGEPS